MPASPTDSTSNATRDRPPTVGAPADVGPPAVTDDAGSPAVVKGAVSPASPTAQKASTGAPTCPTCGGSLERYVGENIHKLQSAWCGRCGVRHHDQAKPASVPAASQPAG